MVLRRRRPLLRAAAVGGTAYMVGKHRARAQDAQAQTDAYQDDSIAQLQQQQPAAPAQPAAQQAAPQAQAGTDLTSELARLGELHNNGILTDAEFEAAKQKVLQG
jgi:membrane protease subunit (stomatin/prohibitin family)